MESKQLSFPGFDELESPEAEEPHIDAAPDLRAAVYAGQIAASSGVERSERAFPVDDMGMLVVSEIKPGMVDPLWGVVIGRYTGKVEKDIKVVPKQVPAAQRPIAATRVYAELVNAKRRAVMANNGERVAELDRSISRWLDYSVNNDLARGGGTQMLRKPLDG